MSDYVTTILSDTPIWYSRFGEASGTSVNDEIGTLDGTTHLSPTMGVTGALASDSNKAITFAAASEQYVTVPNDAIFSFGSGAFSLEIWFKMASGGLTNRWLMSKQEQFGFFIGGDGKLYLDDFSNKAAESSGAVNGDTNWHHAVTTRSGNTYKIYYDGSDVTSTTTTRTFTANSVDVYIGIENDLFGEFDGSLDEPAIYNFELSGAQVANHYNIGHNGPSGSSVPRTATDSFLIIDGVTGPAGSSLDPYGRMGFFGL